jgi:catechol 2,3-dioxygenase
LFHAAYLYPSRLDLARALRRLVNQEIPFQGFADHGVSEALYLADPEGNGIELYVDRPKSQWKYSSDGLEMVTEPLDLDGLLSEAVNDVRVTTNAPQGLRLGHMHLQVSDLGAAESFWSTTVGFDVVQRSFPGALFVSAGGYHHHLGLNVWNSRNTRIPTGDFTGLRSFSVVLPDSGSLTAIGQSLNSPPIENSLSASDADGIVVEFRTTEKS